MIRDYLIGHVRTYVPIAVGGIATWLAAHYGIVIDDSTQTGFVVVATGLTSAVYYGLVRALAQKWPSVGVLLGVNQAPNYSDH